MSERYNIIAESDNSTVVASYTPSENLSTNYQNELQLEAEFIKLLTMQGYEHLHLKTEQDLKNNLRVQLAKLNNFKFSNDEFERLYIDVFAKPSDGIVGKTRKIQEERKFELLLDNGQKKNIIIIDANNIFNNSLQVFNQYSVESGNYKNRYDVSVLVNGLPLVHIELKRRGVALENSFNQIDRYKRDSFWASGGLFEWVQIFVISNGTYTKYFSNTTREETIKSVNKSNTFEFTSFWADANNQNIYDLIDFAKTFFAKHSLLNILTKYCVFTQENRLLVMRSYQIVATERILNKIVCGHNAKKYGSIKAGGYIWHTTGSGKTLTSFKTAQLASKMQFNDRDKTELSKVLFVVDRKDLDYQTMREYDRFATGCANGNTSTKILTEQLLSQDPTKKIIVTTIQKLSNFIKQNEKHEIFDKEVVLIFDECHRSQFGDMHKAIIKKFKKYYIFGFTGTPIFAQNADNKYQTTEQLFGVVRQEDKERGIQKQSALHTYTIVDAINDKNVLKFKVTNLNIIKAKEQIKDKKVSAIDIKKALLAPEYIKQVTNYIIEHYSQYTKTDESYVFSVTQNIKELAKNRNAIEVKQVQNLRGFNSLFATSNIEAAKTYYESFKQVTHNLKIAIIYSFSVDDEQDGLQEENNESTVSLNKPDRDFLDYAIKDYNQSFSVNYSTDSDSFQNYYRDISQRMKNKEIDILIVANMFLTGFDATTLNTLWVDKNLKYHGLLQAFSRTNRILNKVKDFGNIVCFRDLQEELDDALLLFGNKDSKSIIILKPYDDYINGWFADEKDNFEGYKNLVDGLKNTHALNRRLDSYTDSDKRDFIKLYGKILKVRNILTTFDQFDNNNLLTARELQDYQSRYIELYFEFKKPVEQNKENINEDLVFEIELIKQTEINIDYIVELIKKFADSKCQDKEILINIEKAIDSSIELRSKKDLIFAFVGTINTTQNSEQVYTDFETFMNSKRKEELAELIKNENLQEKETYDFVKKAFRNGEIEQSGDEINKLFKPQTKVSRFNKDTAGQSYSQKQELLNKVMLFFERFFNISGKDFE
ncbi:MAG: type I restriction endonuclease subunit R [Clostridiales bacterium]|jgi:type I restriction enzyme R subunit|nr:type I restriction endonuclease subunit R [Clostridiales bacterium]